jgi:hypothetical protein
VATLHYGRVDIGGNGIGNCCQWQMVNDINDSGMLLCVTATDIMLLLLLHSH